MNKSINFYILNRSNKAVAVLSTEEIGEHLPVISAKVEEKLSSYDILTLSIPADAEGSELVKEDYTIIFEDIKGWREYIITEIEDVDGDNVIKTITAELSSVELLDEIVETDITGNNPETILATVLAKTRWSVGTVDTSIYNSSFTETTQFKSVLETIDLISSSFSCEVSFSYTIDQNKIAKRFVNLYKEVGSAKGKRFEVDKDVTEITRTVDTTGIKTAIIPYGKEPSEATEGETQAKRLDIKNVVWSTANGDPVNKPKGQSWIGDPQALANWGKLQADGTRRHRFIALEIETETEAELATMAWVNLGKYTDPSVTYEAKVMDLYTLTGDEEFRHEHVFIGDTVAVIDNYFADPITVKARVVELVRDLIEPLNNEVVLGDAKQTFKVGDVEKAVEDLATQVAKANYNASVAVVNGSGNTTFYGSVEPVDPDKGDTWFRPHPEKPNETQLVIYNGTVWEVVADTSELEEVKELTDQASLESAQAVKDAGIAVETANQAIKNADDKIAVLEGDLAGKLDVDTYDTAKALQDAELAKKVALTTYNTKIGELNTAISGHSTRIENTENGLLSKANSTDVDAVKGRLSTAESTITQHSGLIASKVSNTELDAVKGRLGTAESSITQQAGQIASKVSTTDFNAVKGRVATAESSISQQANEIASRVTKTELTNAVNNIEIGGRNMIVTSTLSFGRYLLETNGTLGSAGGHTATDFIPVVGLQAYVVSALKLWQIRVVYYDASKNYIGGFLWSGDQGSAKIINTPANASFVRWSGDHSNGSDLRTWKFEKGNKATDYSPAPEDIENRVTLAESSITQQAGLIASKVTQTEVDKSIDGIEVGGRNLILKSSESKLLPASTSTYNYFTFVSNEIFVEGETYTFSSDIEKVSGNFTEITVLPRKTDGGGGSVTMQLSIVKGRIVGSFIAGANENRLYVYAGRAGGTANNSVRFLNYKLEKGNKATGWSPAPEDVDTRLTTAESSITQQAGLIQAKVSTADYNSKISQIDSAIQSRVTSDTYNSKMTQLDSSITSVVTELASTDIKTLIGTGLILHDDPTFDSGNNGINVYDNAKTGNVTIAREVRGSGHTNPSGSSGRIKIVHTGSASPNLGGFFFGDMTRANAKFLYRFVAQLPVGYTFVFGSNATGTGGKTTWLTDTKGTGTWTEYAILVECGTTGTFSSTGFFSVTGTTPTPTAPLNWWLDTATSYDLSKNAQSQITQLSSDINLRVTKNDVVNQINVSTEGILIDGAKTHITGKTTIDNAVITSAMIKDVKADSITAGTLNASNVNIINLNANNITAGTLKGTNLSLNLSTGEVLFQKGVIKRSDNLFGMDITNGRLESYSSQGGITMENGSLKLYKTPMFIDPNSRGTYYGSIDYTYSLFAGGSGLTITGTNGAMLRTEGFVTSLSRPTGAGIFVEGIQAKVISEGTAVISGGTVVPSSIAGLGSPPAFNVGAKYSDSFAVGPDISAIAGGYGFKVNSTSGTYRMNFLGNGELSLTNVSELKYFKMAPATKIGSISATFEIGGESLQQYSDSLGFYMRSMTIYNRTTSAAANGYVSSNGTLARSTSASKYKVNISEIPAVENYSARLLEIKPKQWFDKLAVESYVHEMETGDTPIDDLPITPFYGLIAEDLVEAGLEKYVHYGMPKADGTREVEGIMYDRLWTLLIPIVKRLNETVTDLEKEIADLKGTA